MLRKRRFRTGMESFDHYKYNKLNQISARYCCDKNIDNAMIVEEYKFDKGFIKKLKYTEEKKSTMFPLDINLILEIIGWK